MHTTIDIFGTEIPGYGLFVALGFLAVLLYLSLQSYYKDLDFDRSLIILVVAMLSGGISAKVLYWITNPADFFILFDEELDLVLRINYSFTSGFVFIGGLIGMIVAILVYLKFDSSLNKGRVLDVFVIALPIFHIFGRLGCYMAGCCYGSQTTCPIGVTFPTDSLAPAGINLFPTQLISVFGNLFIALILLLLSRKNKVPGKLFSLYLILYSTGRFILEFFRGDEIRGIYYGLSTSQWISIPVLFLGIVLYFAFHNQKRTYR